MKGVFENMYIRRNIRAFGILLFCVFVSKASFAQQIRVTPSAINFHINSGPGVYECDKNEKGNSGNQNGNKQGGINVDVKTSAPSWTITCQAEPLHRVNGDGVIPQERLFVQLETPGTDYFPMIGPIILGYGETSSNQFVTINRMYFQVQIDPEDLAGEYHGLYHFYHNEEELATLNVHVHLKEQRDFEVSPESIYFDVIGPPGVEQSDDLVNVTVETNGGEYQLICEANDIEGSSGTIHRSNLFVNCNNSTFSNDEGAGPGFFKLSYPRTIYEGSDNDKHENLILTFRLKTSWADVADTYDSQLTLDIPGSPKTRFVNVYVTIHEYLAIELSETEVKIRSAGPPDDYDGDRNVKLKVASNTAKWEARAQGEDLVSKDDNIPAERFYLYSSNKSTNGFMSLDVQRVVASGTNIELSEVSQLAFKVKTSWQDRAGDYSGKVYFTVIAIP